MNSIFTRIINGEIPCYKIYEDDTIIAFLDINPVNLGHTLIVPKMEIDQFSDLPEPYYSNLFQVSKKVSQAIQKATNCLRVCAWFEGFEVPHTHFHVCPIYNEIGEFRVKRGSSRTAEEMQEIQEKIITELSKHNL